ncbi:MAG: GntR family transcriptional regulator [Kordiimonadaceae bacterium]|jgi:DNA-binding GntR family transcriptional regulator|nr:GntR family transcriptional regulator [Kordiimonadaceae bacterium]MBT6034956.1 GntR family transcriptional regulator [Kordiimonadaceae bacterium]MBT6330501.1 GntR family transcriptional regulator [Kordiimonadaceae bacterium]MBT7582973.1 GntR family transcriptional regulator [Kordiimonadaceae bacterium]
MTAAPGINLDKLGNIENETAQEWVYRALRFAIMSGQFQPNQALTIRQIAGILNVSAMPVREALKRLTTEGALTIKSNRRIIVPTLIPARLSELIELRVELESFAAIRALPYISAELISHLEDLNDKQNSAFEKRDFQGIILGNQIFHRTLYSAHPHAVTLPMIEQLWLQIGPLHRLSVAKLPEHYTHDRHCDIIDALKHHNPFGLKSAIEADIRESIGFLTESDLLTGQDENLPLPNKDYVKSLKK